MIGQRAGRYEKLLPMWTFVETLQRRSSEAGEQVTQLYTANREQLAECFGEELTGLTGEKRERTLNALAMALAPESWIVLRERLGLTVDQAREEWRFIVKAIFDGRYVSGAGLPSASSSRLRSRKPSSRRCASVLRT